MVNDEADLIRIYGEQPVPDAEVTPAIPVDEINFGREINLIGFDPELIENIHGKVVIAEKVLEKIKVDQENWSDRRVGVLVGEVHDDEMQVSDVVWLESDAENPYHVMEPSSLNNPDAAQERERINRAKLSKTLEAMPENTKILGWYRDSVADDGREIPLGSKVTTDQFKMESRDMGAMQMGFVQFYNLMRRDDGTIDSAGMIKEVEKGRGTIEALDTTISLNPRRRETLLIIGHKGETGIDIALWRHTDDRYTSSTFADEDYRSEFEYQPGVRISGTTDVRYWNKPEDSPAVIDDVDYLERVRSGGSDLRIEDNDLG